MYIKRVYWIFSLFVVILAVSACTTMTTMRAIEPSFKAVKNNFETGDMIKVYTKDNTIITFEVVEITEDVIVGARERIPFKEIASIEKQEVKEFKPTAAGGAVALATFMAAIVGWMVLF
jgi:hypothetical protein